MKFQSSRNYSELGSCPALNTGHRPLLARSLGDSLSDQLQVHEEFVQTSKGKILVVRQGDPRKPVIVTYHDLGLNHKTNFQVRLPFSTLLIYELWFPLSSSLLLTKRYILLPTKKRAFSLPFQISFHVTSFPTFCLFYCDFIW